MSDDTAPNAPKRTRTQRTLGRVAAGDGIGNASRRKALENGCPTCGAAAHKACISPKGDLRWAFHRDRRPKRESARTAAAEAAGIEGRAERRAHIDALTVGPRPTAAEPSLPIERGAER
jgi:hypothetical protein